MRKRALTLLFLILVVSLALALWGGRSPATSSDLASSAQRAEKETRTSLDAVALSGAKVGRDPATGALRPTTAQENEALARAIEKAMEKRPPHAVRRGRDGSLSLVAAPQFLSLSVARVSSDGTLSMDCSDAGAAVSRLRSASKRSTTELPEE